MFAACSTNTTIRYTTINDKPIGVHNISGFRANIISNTYENGIGKIVFDGNITTIPDYAFRDCVNLTSVTIGDSVTSIGGYAFSGCSSLKSITIPDSVTSIGNSAFSSCSSLTNITIPDSVTSIGDSAFRNCSSLTSVTIGKSVTSIRNMAFANCRSLTSIYCKPTTPPLLFVTNTFSDIPSTAKIYVPTASVYAYKTAQYWSSYASKITGYDFNEQSNK